MLFSEKNESLAKKNKLTEQFVYLLDTLKAQGVHVAVAARAINENPVTVRGWKNRGGSGPTQDHINALLLAFPTQLTAKAEEMGLEIPVAQMKMGEVERINQVLEAMRRDKVKLEEELQDTKKKLEELEEAKQQNKILTQHIAQLTERLKSL